MNAFLKRLALSTLVLCAAFSSVFTTKALAFDKVEKDNEPNAVETAALSADAFVRRETCLNDGWRFRLGAGSDYGTDIDDSSWESVNLPHTWNALDGTDGNYDYKRGKGMYRKTVTVPADFAGKRIYIEFGGVNAVSTLYIDGTLVPFVREDGKTEETHNGGYTLFRYDITDKVTPGGTHVFAVCADNTSYPWLAPIDADFTFFGGIYRDVKLLAVPDVHFDLSDNGSEGLYIDAVKKSDTAKTGVWELTVKARLVNQSAEPKTVLLSAVAREPEKVEWLAQVPTERTPFDEDTMTGNALIAQDTETVTLSAGETYLYIKTFSVTDPRLWNGKSDPFRYEVLMTLSENGTILDEVSDKIGFRTYSVDPEKGFFLNGVSYPLRGVSKHQDFDGVGNAINVDMQNTDFGILYEIGANTVRLAHYPYVDYFYDLCDRYGLVVWAEVPFISYIGGTGEYGSFDSDRTKFVETVKTQLVELIRSQYNHPSIVFWSMQNEVDTPYNSVMLALMEKEIYPLTKSEDPYRLATFATFHEQGFSWKADVAALNFYPAWYGYETYHFTTVLKDYHKKYPSLGIGVSEYGAGGSLSQHAENPKRPQPFGDKFHPEEYQTFVHEEIAGQLCSGDLDFLWCTYVWNLFDFGSDKRAEGDRNGINDKGLVSYDRTTKKDAFYVYKAIWSDEAFVHLQRKRFIERDTPEILVKVSSNCDSLSLTVNGQPFGDVLKNDGTGRFTWSAVPLKLGENTISVTGTDKNGEVYTDTAVWTRVQSRNTAISSEILTVDDSKKTIVLRQTFTADKVSDYILAEHPQAVLSVLSSDKTQVITTGSVEPFMVLRVTAEDGETTADYRFIENNIGFGKTVTSGTKSYAALVNGKYDDAVNIEGAGLTKTLILDLQNDYHVNQLVVYPGNSQSTYALSVSRDGTNYTPTALTRTDSSSAVTLAVGDKTARFLRLEITSSASVLSLSEIEVYGWRFSGSTYTVNEANRRIITDTGLTQVPDAVFLETLGLIGNCTYEIVRDSSVFYLSDGDTLKITDAQGKAVLYTICTDVSHVTAHSTNVALGKPVTASDPGQSGRLPAYVTDGVIGAKDSDPRWQAKSGAYPQWLVVDLEDYYSVHSYELVTFAAIYKDRAYGYKLYGSVDGVNYTLLDDRSGNTDTSGVHTGSFAAADVRYVKLEITKSTKGSAGVIELSVYGSASDKTVTAIEARYDTMILAVGSREKAKWKLSPAFAPLPDDLVFASEDETVAFVTSAGTVIGKGVGQTTVTASSASLGLSAAISVTVSDKHVLSLGRPVSLQNNADQTAATPLGTVNDGSLSTRWQGKNAASAENPTYITIDLERICEIEALDASFFNPANRTHYYEISVSTDGQSFTQVVDNLKNSRYNVTTFTHTLTQNVKARYVRLGITGQSAGATPGVYEFTVYGEEADTPAEALTFAKDRLYMGVGDREILRYTVEPSGADTTTLVWESSNEKALTVENGVLTAVGVGGAQISVSTASGTRLAQIDVFVERLRNISVGKKVVAYDDYGVESEAGTGYQNTVENLTDGLVPSSNFNFPRWHVKDREPHYVVIDLEDVYAVEEISLYFFYYKSRAYGYKLSVSLDGETFTDVADRLDNTQSGIRTESFDEPVYARFVRLDVTAPVGLAGSTTGVYEISVYGKPANVPMIEKTSIRTTQPSGIRFAANVPLALKNLAQTEEIGFIVGRKDALAAKNEELTNLVFGKNGPEAGGYTPDGTKYVYGVAYNRADGTNKVYDNNGDKFGEVEEGVSEAITCVTYNIKDVKTELAVRTYIKIGETYCYSAPFTRSIWQTAQMLKEQYDRLSPEEQQLVDAILGTTGGENNG